MGGVAFNDAGVFGQEITNNQLGNYWVEIIDSIQNSMRGTLKVSLRGFD